MLRCGAQHLADHAPLGEMVVAQACAGKLFAPIRASPAPAQQGYGVLK
ncbi:hypothetical protein AAFN46_00910 [Pseudomonas sp. CAU 1711]